MAGIRRLRRRPDGHDTQALQRRAPRSPTKASPREATPTAHSKDCANGATIASLYPFAIFTAIVAVQSLRSNALPHWLGALAGLTAIASLINGSFEYAGTVPGLLMFIIWTLIAGIALFIHELRLQPLRPADRSRAAEMG